MSANLELQHYPEPPPPQKKKERKEKIVVSGDSAGKYRHRSKCRIYTAIHLKLLKGQFPQT